MKGGKIMENNQTAYVVLAIFLAIIALGFSSYELRTSQVASLSSQSLRLSPRESISSSTSDGASSGEVKGGECDNPRSSITISEGYRYCLYPSGAIATIVQGCFSGQIISVRSSSEACDVAVALVKEPRRCANDPPKGFDCHDSGFTVSTDEHPSPPVPGSCTYTVTRNCILTSS